MVRRGQRTAVVAAAGVTCIVAASAFLWSDIATAYYLHRLRTDSGYFETLLSEAHAGPKRRAMRLYLETTEGATTLVDAFVSSCEAVFRAEWGDEDCFESFQTTVLGIEQPFQQVWFRMHVGSDGSMGSSYRGTSHRTGRAQQVYGWLRNVAGRHIRLQEHAGFLFMVLAGEDALSASERICGGDIHPRLDPVVLIKRDAELPPK